MAEGAETAVEEAHGELSLARVALAEDDLAHAASHLAGALGLAPGLPEVHELLAALAARTADGGLSLFPLREPAFIGTVVAHAHLLAPADPARALGMLARATAAAPEQPWADVSWVRALDAGSVAGQALAQVFTTVMRPLGDPAEEPVRTANEVYLDLARRAVAAHPDDAMVHATAAGVGRRLGATGAAVGWGARAVELQPSKLTLVWYAYALRADGRDDDGIDVLREAYRRFPSELDLCADLANWLAATGRAAEAIALLEEAVARDPSYDCVVHTLHSMRFDEDGDVAHLIELADYTRDHPPSGHEHYELETACRGRPWLGLPAGATEACVNMLAQVPEGGGELGTMALSALEVPSALALVRRRFPGVTIDIGGETPPDMTSAVRPGRALWTYIGKEASPAVPPPSQEAVELARRVVTPVWAHPIAAYDQALPLGQLPIDDLLGLIVHPPEAPDGPVDLPPGWWERSVQTYACLGVLHSAEPGRKHPTDTTAHRRILAEVAFGVEDWATEAALFALVVAAWLDPGCRTEVAAAVGMRFVTAARAAQGRVVTILDSLAELVLITPELEGEVRGLAREVLSASAPSSTPASLPEPPSPPVEKSWLRRLFGRRSS
ncbi:tetratricopeptide repeat protein [Actinoplanes sp. RD1]|uniref:tetratricopeptide repeat protein n=1 Tax=Actinoplanes sp. RD1 TaxID=3064538 RepID=UPI00274288A0|nr:tetratricopeptide repeat protein [Actinoplanes sp. RD1]